MQRAISYENPDKIDWSYAPCPAQEARNELETWAYEFETHADEALGALGDAMCMLRNMSLTPKEIETAEAEYNAIHAAMEKLFKPARQHLDHLIAVEASSC
jgi:hypothetical protein